MHWLLLQINLRDLKQSKSEVLEELLREMEQINTSRMRAFEVSSSCRHAQRHRDQFTLTSGRYSIRNHASAELDDCAARHGCESSSGSR